MGTKRYWSKRNPTRRTDLPKMVFEVPAEDIYRRGFLGLGPEDEREPYELCRRLAESMSMDVPGDVKEMSIGSNGSRSRGFCITDPFGRNIRGESLTKAYPVGDRIRVVYPGYLGSGYLEGLTGVKNGSWKRLS